MRKFFVVYVCLSLIALPSCAKEPETLERKVIERVEENPETAPEYFLEQIEAGANVEAQAVYLYGMGLAAEKQGDTVEAINNYIGAETLGNESAAKALKRLRD